LDTLIVASFNHFRYSFKDLEDPFLKLDKLVCDFLVLTAAKWWTNLWCKFTYPAMEWIGGFMALDKSLHFRYSSTPIIDIRVPRANKYLWGPGLNVAGTGGVPYLPT